MNAAVLPAHRPRPLAMLAELTKLRISGASTLTAAAGYIACRRGVDVGLVPTLAGILLLAMGSSALNEFQERHLDARMPRTWHRPLPRGDIQPGTALVLALGLGLAGFLVLRVFLPASAAWLGALALAWYNGVYTPLKRFSAFAVVPGSLIGALPPAIGWAAAGGDLRNPALLALAFVFFIWQVPHFWLLVTLHAEGYEQAGFPTLVQVLGRPRLARLTFTWIIGTATACSLLPVFHVLGTPPAVLLLAGSALALALGALPLLREAPSPRTTRRVFMNVNLFALLLTAAVVLDPFLAR